MTRNATKHSQEQILNSRLPDPAEGSITLHTLDTDMPTRAYIAHSAGNSVNLPEDYRFVCADGAVPLLERTGNIKLTISEQYDTDCNSTLPPADRSI